MMKLYESELKVLEVLWQQGDMRAARVCDVLAEKVGWNPNTTYTVMKKCIHKGYVERKDPGFWCHPLITKDEVRNSQMRDLVNRLFGGSGKKLFEVMIKEENCLTDEERKEICELLEKKQREYEEEKKKQEQNKQEQ